MAISNPIISNYKPFYIQTGAIAEDTAVAWGLIAKANPYPAIPTPKKPYSNTWLDEDGDDEYNEHLYYEAFTFDVKFYICAEDTLDASGSVVESAPNIIRRNIQDFFLAIKDGEFMIYDAYTALGRKKVRYAGFKEDTFKSRVVRLKYRNAQGTEVTKNGNRASCIFTITFKVNDPITSAQLVNGVIYG